MASLIDECDTTKNYSLAIFQNVVLKNTRSSVIGIMDNGIPSSSSDSAMASNKNRKRCDTFKIQMKIHFYILKQSMMQCLRIGRKYSFVIRPLKAMLNHVMVRLSLQQLEHEMERADLPDDCNFFKYDIVATLTYLTHTFNSSKPLN